MSNIIYLENYIESKSNVGWTAQPDACLLDV